MPPKPKGYKHPPYNPGGDDRTKQSFRDETNINNIIAKFKRTGVLEGARSTPPRFADFGTATDFMEVQNLLIEAKEQFMSLPAKLRTLFQNDPARLLAWLENPANRAQAIELGLIVPEQGPIDPYLTTEEFQAQELDRLNDEARKQAQEAANRADPESQPSHGRKAGKQAENQ